MSEVGLSLVAAATPETHGHHYSHYTPLATPPPSPYRLGSTLRANDKQYRTPQKTSLEGTTKAAELARLGDFFSRLANGDHKSLYEEVSKTPRKNPNITRSQRFQSESPSPSKPVKVALLDSLPPLDSIPLARTVSSETATSYNTDSTTSNNSSENDGGLSSPPSSVSSFPASAEDCGDESASDTSDEEDEEATRGRTRTREPAGRFRKSRRQPITYTAHFPGGSFSSYTPFVDRVAEGKNSTGGKFTFKMMLHELYEDLDEFIAMVERVLEESKQKYRPLEKVKHSMAQKTENTRGKWGMDETKSENVRRRERAVSTLEGNGQVEMVRNVVERAKKRRRMRTEELVLPQENKQDPDEASHSQTITHRKYIFREQVSSDASTGEAGNGEQRVPRDDADEEKTAVRRKVLDEQGPLAVSIRPRMKRRLST